ncbi:MAG: hypothetical protein J1F39_05900 [Clostridiales bacterium]|nr:hypothetical protein [Clostridiales bacterium]
MKRIKVRSFAVTLMMALLIMFFTLMLFTNYGFVSIAESETSVKQSDELREDINKNNLRVDNAVESGIQDFIDVDDIESPFENLTIPSNCVINVYSSTQTILDSILSEAEFTIEGTISSNAGTFNINDYYDFADSNKFQIAEWAHKVGLISYEEKTEIYCDLLLEKKFNNVICLESIIDEIRVYSDTVDDIPFQDKLNAAVDPRSVFFYDESIASVDIVALSNELNYSSANFKIYYDASSIILADAIRVANFFESIRIKYYNMGFNYPKLEPSQSLYRVYLDPNSNGNTLGTTTKVNVSGNTCASYIYLYNFHSLNDQVRATIAHEYFHAIQNSYNHQSGWFKEACASWGAINTCDVYTNTLGWIMDFIANSTSISMHSLSGYDAVVFPLTIQRNYGGTDAILSIYKEYNKYSADIVFSSLTMVVSDGILHNGYSCNFSDAYKSMSAFLINPRVWLNSVIDTTKLFGVTPVKRRLTIATQSLNGSLDSFASTYLEIELPSGVSAGNVKMDVTFSSANGSIQTYTVDKNGEHQILYPKTSATGICNIERTDIGNEINTLIFVLSNTDFNSSITYTANISYSACNDVISFESNTRYVEEMCYISDGSYKEYSVNFATSGYKTMQLFSPFYTRIRLYSASGSLLASDSMSGYMTAGFICYKVDANTNYKIRVSGYETTINGYLKLSIIPAHGE